MPWIEDMHSALRRCTMFSVIDIKAYQIPKVRLEIGVYVNTAS